MPADPIKEFWFRGLGGGRRIFREANPTIGFGNNRGQLRQAAARGQFALFDKGRALG